MRKVVIILMLIVKTVAYGQGYRYTGPNDVTALVNDTILQMYSNGFLMATATFKNIEGNIYRLKTMSPIQVIYSDANIVMEDGDSIGENRIVIFSTPVKDAHYYISCFYDIGLEGTYSFVYDIIHQQIAIPLKNASLSFLIQPDICNLHNGFIDRRIFCGCLWFEGFYLESANLASKIDFKIPSLTDDFFTRWYFDDLVYVKDDEMMIRGLKFKKL